ncbi:MAG: hypothetical protein WBH31_11260 [Promethearchaeia archaeon]
MSYEIWSLVIQIAGLGSIVALIITYVLDKRWKRTEAAHNFYDEFDDNVECRLAMFMLDYGKEDAEFEFNYIFLKVSDTVKVQFTYSKLNDSMTKPYEDLTEDEQVIRYIFDVYIGYLERVFYFVNRKYFKKKELFFYKYWLDIIASEKFKEIRNYAVENSCGLFNPYLEKYQKKIKRGIENKILKISVKSFIKRRKILKKRINN